MGLFLYLCRLVFFDHKFIKGLTGFDSKDDGFVSMSGYADCPVKTFCKTLIGENNFALAA